MSQPPNPSAPSLPGCWWHPNRPTGLSCARCGRPACPDCLREAPVGFQCTDCVQTGAQQQKHQHRQYRDAGMGSRTIAGARLSNSYTVTATLIAVNVVIFLITVIQAKSLFDNNLALLQVRLYLQPVLTLGAGEWWRVFTSGFLHYGPIHIAANAFSLWMIGRALEQVFGKIRYLALYFVSMLGASTAVLLFGDGTPTVGASGAIFGLLGSYAVITLKLRLNPTALLINLVINAYITFSIPGISIWAHVGGLVTGALVTAAMLYAPARNLVRWQAIGTAVVAIALVGLIGWRATEFPSLDCSPQLVQGDYKYFCKSSGSS
ncbi:MULTISPECIES: rhomboid family intramembrane serine protease [Amycolatopsis]|uniref:Membrane associated serine protease, rhomboid family n=2 Tax=Amycolatopsis rubida TaxID=112413 RepID=A0A1I5F241_9PSEU|nr:MULTISPECIES: rhomboid family intramembrane serine protease [Amycolatopsis]MYW94430.1 rhomboid family intramembrane serine protease [Amycolatopsis rubida]OAP27137.1 Rhomboid protease GluP [Amycolatopsis sp. M39]SFO17753.1 Membrane associated serine protease, rhomboid family [Amycolatopsis rubida]